MGQGQDNNSSIYPSSSWSSDSQYNFQFNTPASQCWELADTYAANQSHTLNPYPNYTPPQEDIQHNSEICTTPSENSRVETPNLASPLNDSFTPLEDNKHSILVSEIEPLHVVIETPSTCVSSDTDRKKQ
jgi:hypothetical protein